MAARRRGTWVRIAGFGAVLALLPSLGRAEPATPFACLLSIGAPPSWRPVRELLVQYVRDRDDLAVKERKRWETELRKRFGSATSKEEDASSPDVAAARAIIAAAIFMHTGPARGSRAAWAGFRSVLARVPPPIAVHYEVLALEGRRPRVPPAELALKFPEHYSEEIAPELVAYWESALASGKIPDDVLRETKEALEATRLRMRSLLLDKLRLLARLDRELRVARGARTAEVEHDLKEVEEELARSFVNVARRPEVVDARKRPYDRLRIQIEDMGLALTEEDRFLDPDAPPPPRREIATATLASDPRLADPPLTEPDTPPPSGPLPPQPRPGDPSPRLPRASGRSLGELSNAYRRRLEAIIRPWLGTPYAWGSELRGVATDCSGFTQKVFEEAFQIDLPRTSRDQYRTGYSVPLDGLRAGDLLFFDMKDAGRITHAGVYAGDGLFVHASPGNGVMYARLSERSLRRAYRGARRVLVYPE